MENELNFLTNSLINKFFRDYPIATKKDFKAELPFPGLTQENLELEINENQVLTIKTNIPDDAEGFITRFKNKYYEYYLGEGYDLNNVEAKMENGLLKLYIPLKEKTERKLIQIG